jgi:hypothetical protein
LTDFRQILALWGQDCAFERLEQRRISLALAKGGRSLRLTAIMPNAALRAANAADCLLEGSGFEPLVPPFIMVRRAGRQA